MRHFQGADLKFFLPVATLTVFLTAMHFQRAYLVFSEQAHQEMHCAQHMRI